jgi:hypothetical protein
VHHNNIQIYKFQQDAHVTEFILSGRDGTVHFQLFHDSSRQQYGVTVTGCCGYSRFVLLKMGDNNARNM